jgi:SAM-dependent methyltransferase
MSQLMAKMVKDGHLGGYIPGGDPGTWCPALWTWAIDKFAVRSMLDVGCGEGHSARFFQERGCTVLGVEGCPRALADSVIPGRVAAHDFTTGPFFSPRSFDLIWSCEFIEHVESQHEANILATFAHAAKAILVTHAFPRQTAGHHHVNCRPSWYWVRRIESVGFTCHVPLTMEARTVTLRDFPGINHFARSGLVFVRTNDNQPGYLKRFAHQWNAHVKAWKLHWDWRWSRPYRQQKKRHRQMKRDLKAMNRGTRGRG